MREGATLTGSYWPADTSEPVLDTTIGGILREAAERAPAATALVEGDPDPSARRTWTFAELLDDSERAARALLRQFEPRERVAVWANNIPEWVVLEFATALAGMTLVTVNPANRAAELAHVLGHSGANGLFLVDEYRGNPMLETATQLRDSLPRLRDVIRFADWESFCASGDGGRALPTVSPDDPAQVLYTSGTTGRPKGAVLHHRGLTNNAALRSRRWA